MVLALVGKQRTKVLRSTMAVDAWGKSKDRLSSKFCSPELAMNDSSELMVYYVQRELQWYIGRAAESRRDS